MNSTTLGSLERCDFVHLELGATNYNDGIPQKKYSILLQTIDDLMKKHKSDCKGIFFINDLDENACSEARAYLSACITEKYPKASIEVKIIAKNYLEIEPKEHLPPKQKFSSIHFKNPAQFQLYTAINHSTFLIKLIENSERGISLIIPTDFTGSVIKNALKISPSGVRREERLTPLRYEDNPDINAENYVYVSQWGIRTEDWKKSMAAYTIRKAHPNEIFSEQELLERSEKKKEIIAEVSRLFSELVTQIKNDPDFPLIKAFQERAMESSLNLNLNEEEKLFSHLGYIEDLDTCPKDTEYKNIEKLKKSFEKEKRLLDNKLSEIKESYLEGLNYLKLKKFLSKKNPEELWGRLGLANAFQIWQERSKTPFWDSEKSLRTIYRELLEIKYPVSKTFSVTSLIVVLLAVFILALPILKNRAA